MDTSKELASVMNVSLNKQGMFGQSIVVLQNMLEVRLALSSNIGQLCNLLGICRSLYVGGVGSIIFQLYMKNWTL